MIIRYFFVLLTFKIETTNGIFRYLHKQIYEWEDLEQERVLRLKNLSQRLK